MRSTSELLIFKVLTNSIHESYKRTPHCTTKESMMELISPASSQDMIKQNLQTQCTSQDNLLFLLLRLSEFFLSSTQGRLEPLNLCYIYLEINTSVLVTKYRTARTWKFSNTFNRFRTQQ